MATADVQFRKGIYSGAVNVDRMPEGLRSLFEEYEEIVNNQIFSLLDQVEDRIGEAPFFIVFNDGQESRANDLQIFPKGGTISFKLSEPAMLGADR